MTRRLDEATAKRWARAVRQALDAPYPAVRGAPVRGPADATEPTAEHPAFHGAVRWHAAVHGLWSLVRLARRIPALEPATREVLDERLDPDAVAGEVSFLTAHPRFERPYGWAWLLVLATEVARLAPDAGWAAALAPLADLLTDRLHSWLPGEPYPDRAGTTSNSAFALLLVHHRAVATDDEELRERVVTTARRWFLPDAAAPASYEPSAGDIVSPILTEAHLMARILDGGDFDTWYDTFLPDTARVIPPSLREPPRLGEAADETAVRRRGLTLSRAWSWREIGRGLPPRDDRRVAALDAADRHLAAGLEAMSGSPAADHHRLVTFGVLALDGVAPRG